jgi:hypothetical protein
MTIYNKKSNTYKKKITSTVTPVEYKYNLGEICKASIVDKKRENG